MATDGGLCVVIDAGHGGKDPGTVRGSIYEKNINLSVAKLVGAFIKDNIDGVKVIYTRNDDSFLTLSQRTDVANNADADIFISIHTNSSPNKTACGTETYVMGVDKSKANLAVSMRENGVISLENDYSQRYEGYDPQSSESLIMFSLMQYGYLSESIAFAKMVQCNYNAQGMADRGVKQAGFLVLWRTSMPSILTEIGYLSNEKDADYILSSKGQAQIARSIADAAVEYLKAGQQEKVEPEKEVAHQNVCYGVQIKSSTSKIAINSMNFGPYVMSIVEFFDGKYYKYVVRGCDIYKETLLLQGKLREKYGDAFVVAFDGVGIIPLDRARKLIEQ